MFVLALGVVVEAVVTGGPASGLGRLLPDGDSLPALLGVAAVAAVLANVVNNLPAVLALLPLAAPAGPAHVLAVLIGVNLGPNLTYVGSLATLLWRRILHRHGIDVSLARFTLLGLLTVPATVAASTVALWGRCASSAPDAGPGAHWVATTMQRRSSPTASGAPSTRTPSSSSVPVRFQSRRSTASGAPLSVTSAVPSPAPSVTANSPVRCAPARPRHRPARGTCVPGSRPGSR